MQAATLPAPPREDSRSAPDRANALDDPAEWESFSRRLAGAGQEGCWESYLAIQGMYCPGCSLTVEQALLAQPGVQEVQVNGGTATARLTPISPRRSRCCSA